MWALLRRELRTVKRRVDGPRDRDGDDSAPGRKDRGHVDTDPAGPWGGEGDELRIGRGPVRPHDRVLGPGRVWDVVNLHPIDRRIQDEQPERRSPQTSARRVTDVELQIALRQAPIGVDDPQHW